MALKAVKETSLPATLCRSLSTPNSPSIRATQTSSVKPPSKAPQLLAALDTVLLPEPATSDAPSPGQVKAKAVSRSIAALTPKTLAPPTPYPLIPPLTDKTLVKSAPTSGKRTKPASAPSSSSFSSTKHSISAISWPMSKPVSRSQTLPVPEYANELADAAVPATLARAKSDSTVKAAQREPALPLYSCKDYSPAPCVVYTRHEKEADDLVQCLRGPLGFDMEWRVILRKGQKSVDRSTALIQLSDERMVLLVQVSAMKKCPQKVREVIESASIPKLGVNIRNDGEKLFRDFSIVASNLVELGAVAQHADPSFSSVYSRSIVSLARMVARYTCRALDKGPVRMSNWETQPLSRAQIDYAANDAHCALMVYKRLLAIAEENNISLTSKASSYTSSLADATSAERIRAVKPASVIPDTPAAGKPSSRAPAPYARPPHSRSVGYATVADDADVVPEVPIQAQYGALALTRPTAQMMRAYSLWHYRETPLEEICATLRSKENPLAHGTVISYVVRALQLSQSLVFSVKRLKTFVQLDVRSWVRHRDWILQIEQEIRAGTHKGKGRP